MIIEKIKLSEIKPYENNAKKHPKEQIEQIKKSINEFGMCDPIAIDENNVIIEGHGRYIALNELGYKEVDCIRIENLTEEQKRAYILVHNKLTMNTGFDMEKVEKEIEQIKSIDMSYFDFDIYPEEIELPEVETEDQEEIYRMTLNFSEEQFQEVQEAIEIIEATRKELHSFGNKNKSSNLLNEVIYEWAERKKLL